MFRASSRPSSGATTTAVAASGLPSELGASSAVGRGRANRLTSDRVERGWRKLRNEELHDLCCSPNIISIIKLRMR